MTALSVSTFDVPSGGYQTVRPCSAQLVATYGPGGRCLHQEVIIHLLPSNAQNMMTAAFFHPLQSHGRGTTKTKFPQKCSSVITSIYVDVDNPATFRCGIRAFYNKERNMKAQDAIDKIESIIGTLEGIKEDLEANDTYDFDIDRQLGTIETEVINVEEYVEDELEE